MENIPIQTNIYCVYYDLTLISDYSLVGGLKIHQDRSELVQAQQWLGYGIGWSRFGNIYMIHHNLCGNRMTGGVYCRPRTPSSLV